MAMQGQPQCECCDTGPTSGPCEDFSPNFIAQCYRVVIIGCTFPNAGFSFCETDGCPDFNGTYVFGPTWVQTGGTEADPLDTSCCNTIDFGPYCDDGFGNKGFDKVQLCFRYLGSSSPGAPYMVWLRFFQNALSGCDNYFYKQWVSAPDPMTFADEILGSKHTDGCCDSILAGTCKVTAIACP